MIRNEQVIEYLELEVAKHTAAILSHGAVIEGCKRTVDLLLETIRVQRLAHPREDG